MNISELKERNFEGEFRFSASRSKGPGGQNVNKLNTKVELRFNIYHSKILLDGEKSLINAKLRSKMNQSGELIIYSQETRSQIRNKQLAIEKFFLIISKALIPERKRIKTRRTKRSQEHRLKRKNIRSMVKKTRSKPDID